MALTDFTTYAEVRAVLGVSEPEITDTVLALPMYEVLLTEDLRELNEDLEADFLAADALPSPTADQARFVYLVETYCGHKIGSLLIGSLPMFAPRVITDSSSGFERMADPYQNMRQAITDTLAYLRVRVLEAYATLTPAAPAPIPTVRVLVANVGLGTDPVTGA